MYYLTIFITGGLIALMLSLNSSLTQSASLIPSLILIHTTGLLASLLLFDKKPASGGKVSFGFYTAGLLGVGLTLADIACVTTLGLTMTIALKLFGQLCGAWLIDTKGLLGLTKKASSPERFLTLVMAAIGCLVMIDFPGLLQVTVWFAIIAGILQSVIAALNTTLGSRIGTFNAVKINFLTGLMGSLLLFPFLTIPLNSVVTKLVTLPWYVLFGGGLCGVLIVSSMTICYRHISLLTATLLLFIGQLIFGGVLDSLSGLPLSTRMMTGGGIMLVGLAIEWLLRLRRIRAMRPSEALAGTVGYLK